MGSIFITYGAKSGGAPPFLKRTRSAYAQNQTRTKTAANVSQLQQRQRTCSCTTSSGYTWVNYGATYCGYEGGGNSCSSIFANNQSGCHSCNYYNSSPWGHPCFDSCGYGTYECTLYYCYEYYSNTSCSWGTYGSWTNTSSCTASSPGCSNGAVQTECRTVTVCAFGDWTEWSNTESCTAATPSCVDGAVQVECQVVYNWGEWSAWEESETCTAQSPEASNGAIQIECQPN